MKGVNQGAASGPYDIALIQAQVCFFYIWNTSYSICMEVTLACLHLDRIIYLNFAC